MSKNTETLKIAGEMIYIHYTGDMAWRSWLSLFIRCIWWWLVGCCGAFFLIGGMLLMYLIFRPYSLASSMTEMIDVGKAVFLVWKEISLQLLIWIIPLLCVLMKCCLFWSAAAETNVGKTRKVKPASISAKGVVMGVMVISLVITLLVITWAITEDKSWAFCLIPLPLIIYLVGMNLVEKLSS